MVAEQKEFKGAGGSGQLVQPAAPLYLGRVEVGKG